MISRKLMLPAILAGLLVAVTGCEDPPADPFGDQVSDGNAQDYNDWEEEEEEIIVDDYYEVIDRRSAGGDLYEDSDERDFTGAPVTRRNPVEYMIVVRGNNTGEESAYLLPHSDFSRVNVGTRLRESTLARWESTSSDHIPPETDRDDDDTGVGRVRDDRSPFDPTYEPM